MPRQYKVTPGFLVEMPRMEKPKIVKPKYPTKGEVMDAKDENFFNKSQYNAHIASLQKIPIAPGVKFEGEIINEDQFEVKRLDRIGMEHPDGDPYAYPVKPKQPEGKEKGERGKALEWWGLLTFSEQAGILKKQSIYSAPPSNDQIESIWRKETIPSPQPQPTQEEVGRDERDTWAEVSGSMRAAHQNRMPISQLIDWMQSRYSIQKRNTNG